MLLHVILHNLSSARTSEYDIAVLSDVAPAIGLDSRFDIHVFISSVQHAILHSQPPSPTAAMFTVLRSNSASRYRHSPRQRNSWCGVYDT